LSGHVTVRMYNVGFGDCFLLTFPAPDRPRKVLIDCGVHAAGPGPAKMSEVVDRVIADVREDGGAMIDVVVATHRHRDHVLGFESRAWDAVRVGEVWMPWTEHPTDPEARRIREAQSRKARQLLFAFQSLALDPAERTELVHLTENSLTNAKAMETLHHGFRGGPSRRFLPSRNGRRIMRPSALPRVTVHLLGPSRDEDVIRDMQPPREESFLRAAAAAAGGGPERPPFPPSWSVSPVGDAFAPWLRALSRKARPRPKPGTRPLRPADPGFVEAWVAGLGIDEKLLREVDGLGRDDALAAAVALDKAVNGTSLMLLFQMGRALLLFPGDAQWGTWKRALDDPAWREMLGGLSFYKVGHHGSHNATPATFLDDVAQAPFTVMVSTKATKRYREIPRRPLLERLMQKCPGRVVRSDDPQVAPPFERKGPLATETRIPV